MSVALAVAAVIAADARLDDARVADVHDGQVLSVTRVFAPRASGGRRNGGRGRASAEMARDRILHETPQLRVSHDP